jgi:hypothetical protein
MGTGCDSTSSANHSLWSDEAQAWMDSADRSIMGVGLTGGLIDHDQLVETGNPPSLMADDTAIVGWGWFANLQERDQLRIAIVAPDGATLFDAVSEPLDRAKASYSQFAGRKRSPEPGRYAVTVQILRHGQIVEAQTENVLVQ